MTGSAQKMMMGWSCAVIAFGIVLIGAVFAPSDGPANLLFDLVGGATPTIDRSLRFSVGLMGAVTLGWGLTVLAVASVSHRLDALVARTLWLRMMAAFGVWYVIDSTISIMTGFTLNAVSNTVLAIAFVLIVRRVGVSSSRSTAAGIMGAART